MVDPKNMYLDLLKLCLTDLVYGEPYFVIGKPKGLIKRLLFDALRRRGIYLVRHKVLDEQLRIEGGDWPLLAHTMIGLKRLNHLQFCIEDVLSKAVPGDLIETGVWRGGATILMRAVLKANNISDREIWVADSFDGLPPPNPEKYPADSGDIHHTFEPLRVSLEQVKSNFASYGMLDDQVKFLKGWFCDTLPTLSMKKWAVIRLDGDMYESTMDALQNLYPNLSPGGYLIVDDYHLEPCRKAVQDYRLRYGIKDEIHAVDSAAVYWRRHQ